MDYFRIADNPETISPCDLGARCLTATTCKDSRMASSPHDFEEPDGSADFFNQRWLDYTGPTAKQALGSGWEVVIHPDDLPRILETFR
jgi:hypothetical protein